MLLLPKHLALVLGVALCLAACESPQPYSGWTNRPQPKVAERPASLVFSSVMAQAGEAEMRYGGEGGVEYLPWYAERNDHGPVVMRGYQSPVAEQNFNYSYDRQYTTNGRAREYSYQHTYRRRYFEEIR
ncbi:MAG: hypothetical protein IT443_07130 [Phycisphaeraceae bacterium]|nr:hypothetical protein [Phycisphaeraceae bacterium]